MSEADTDLEILHPDETATVAGREITMREFGFVEGLKAEVRAAPILAAMARARDATQAGGDDDAGELDIAGVLFEALASHPETVCELVAQACDQPLDWVRSLSDEDGQMLLVLFAGANAGFFARRLWRRRQLATDPDSPTSTRHSSATASGAAPPRSVN